MKTYLKINSNYRTLIVPNWAKYIAIDQYCQFYIYDVLPIFDNKTKCWFKSKNSNNKAKLMNYKFTDLIIGIDPINKRLGRKRGIWFECPLPIEKRIYFLIEEKEKYTDKRMKRRMLKAVSYTKPIRYLLYGDKFKKETSVMFRLDNKEQMVRN